MTAASAGIPSYAQSLSSDHSELPEDYNRYTKDYAEFCALPPKERVFYKVSDGGIVPTMLDEANWQPGIAYLNPRSQNRAPGHAII